MFYNWAWWINVGAFSTLITLKVKLSNRVNQDLVRGLCKELEVFPLTNVLEILDINIWLTTLSMNGNGWMLCCLVTFYGCAELQSVLSCTFSCEELRYSLEVRKESKRISQQQFPRLQETTDVEFDFLMNIQIEIFSS